MRKIIFLIVCIISIVNLKAQVALPVAAPGNVLVNGTTASNASVASTATTGFKFSINGAAIYWGTGVNTVTSPTLYFRNTTATTGRIYGINSDNSGLFTIADATGTTSPLTHVNRFVINSLGNIGIGTAAPTSLFSLGSALGNSKLAVWDNGTTLRSGLGWQTGQLRLHVSATTDKFSFLSSEAAATDLMTILGTGNVGVNVAAPTQKLDVGGTVKSTGLILTTGTPATAQISYQYRCYRINHMVNHFTYS